MKLSDDVGVTIAACTAYNDAERQGRTKVACMKKAIQAIEEYVEERSKAEDSTKQGETA